MTTVLLSLEYFSSTRLEMQKGSCSVDRAQSRKHLHILNCWKARIGYMWTLVEGRKSIKRRLRIPHQDIKSQLSKPFTTFNKIPHPSISYKVLIPLLKSTKIKPSNIFKMQFQSLCSLPLQVLPLLSLVSAAVATPLPAANNDQSPNLAKRGIACPECLAVCILSCMAAIVPACVPFCVLGCTIAGVDGGDVIEVPGFGTLPKGNGTTTNVTIAGAGTGFPQSLEEWKKLEMEVKEGDQAAR
ncbi:hypothetical protein EJ08DRAFT_676452 [Tothia fuscella]|uniref:Uncharacterized protein n=1 Tax=Tothia fuscella TaxID=1048955 RepID=A0A9P4NXB4_9PEZI|nr:hypothetical protein EJ08DRAFT_676452 [Tothia fuscella]